MQQSERLLSMVLHYAVVLQNDIDSWGDLRNEETKSTKPNVANKSGEMGPVLLEA